MKLETFAKIVEIDGGQVLFWREADEDNDGREKINQVICADGLIVNVAVGGMTEEQGDKYFASIGDETARVIVTAVEQMLEEAA